jgi:hypothetical protein
VSPDPPAPEVLSEDFSTAQDPESLPAYPQQSLLRITAGRSQWLSRANIDNYVRQQTIQIRQSYRKMIMINSFLIDGAHAGTILKSNMCYGGQLNGAV